ncbi:MAG: FtsW/RodA/SpoVE family cell cycle protein [Akkermansiaceae bacterium]|nr:FtsW/RodA/SpoVE family cell cycle protein [Akkermansiaceae bacterium]
MNWVLILVMYALLIFGVLMIESAARHLSVPASVIEEYGSSGAYFAAMQKRWILLGTLVYFGVALIDYRWMRWMAIPFYVVSVVLMAMAMGQDDAVHRLSILGISFQPAQLGIASGIILISFLLHELARIHRWLAAPLVRIGVIGVLSAIPFLMVIKMGDMGSALVWVPVAFVALIASGVPFRYLSFMSLIGVGILPWLYLLVLPVVSERGPERIDTWLRMMQGKEVSVKEEGYAAHHISLAVGKADWKGIGWGADEEDGSRLAKGFIPKDTAHNDYIFAVIGEELGFRGSLLLITAFALLLIQALFVAYYSRDYSGRVLSCLVAALFFAHVFESIGMCVLLTPITGIPMPLVSYSGTFVVICMMLLGLVQSVWVHRNSGPTDVLDPA